MVTPRVLTFNLHEPYLCMMAETGLPMDVGLYESGFLARTWHEPFRPVPPNLSFVAEKTWRERLDSGYYDVVIAHNESNALDVATAKASRILVCHNRLSFLRTTIPAENPEGLTAFQLLVDQLPHFFEFVFISETKRADYGIRGRVILPGLDVEAWGGYQGDIARIIRVGNTMRQRNLMFDVDFQEACCAGLDHRVVGVNPLIPGSEPSRSFADLQEIYRSHRCLLHVSREAYEDGYNLAMLEAMACGMPVAALANATSPITNEVDGFVSPDSAALRGYLARLLEDPAYAREIGARGRETVARKFPLDAFVERWRETIFAAADRKQATPATGAAAKQTTAVPTLITFINAPHTTGRYIREAMRQAHPTVSTGAHIPDSMLLSWGFPAPVPAYPAHDIETSPEPALHEIADHLPPGFSPRLLLWVDSGQGEMAPGLKEIPAFKVAWFIDTHVAIEHRIVIARHFDYVFLAQKAQIPQFQAAGIKRVAWLPLACAEDLHQLPPCPRDLDVAFVGSLVSASGQKRKDFIDAVRGAFPNHFIGHAWPHEMAAYYARAKIVVNMCVNEDVNMRVFEAMGAGALLITDPAIGLDELFEDGRDLVVYHDVDDALAKIRRYLDDEESRNAIAAAGRAKVLGAHTYGRRIQTLMDEVQKVCGPLAKPMLHHDPKTAEEYYEHPRRELLPAIPQRARRVLDVGCGAGALGKVLKEERGVEVMCGVEFIEEAYHRARGVLDQVLLGNIEEMDLPWEDGYFDCIICADVLEHLVDPSAVLAKLNRVLSPQGLIIISVPNARFFDVVQMLSYGSWTYCEQGILDATHLRFFTRIDLRTMIEQGGMEAADILPLNQWPPSHLPKNEDGSLSLGLITYENVDDEAYDEFLTYQWLAVVCKPGFDPLALARQAMDAGEYEVALGLAADAVGVNDIEQYSLAARALARLGQLEKADETYRTLLSKTEAPEILGEYGILLLAMNDGVQARPYLERALAALPDFDRADGALGLLKYQAGDLEGSYPHLERALAASFSNRGLLDSFMDVASRLKRLDAALPTIQSYLEFFPGNLDLKITYARVLCDLGDPAGAREQVDLVLLFDAAHQGALALQQALDEAEAES